MTDETALLETRELSKQFTVGRSLGDILRRRPAEALKAVDGVSVAVGAGQTLGVVGETGSGKTTLGRLILRLERPTAGDVLFHGRSILKTTPEESQQLRKRIQVILQDPYSSLNPYRSVGASLAEVLKVHHIGSASTRRNQVGRLLETVGFSPDLMTQKPGQLSGGGRQRVSIARALAVGPELIVADEPVSALDVSVQAQVLNLFEELRTDLGLTYVFITHDLAVVQRLSDTIAVMYLGKVVESAPTEKIFANPLHPYTKALLEAAPTLPARRKSTSPVISGDMPNPISPPAGCPFHTRCPDVMEICRTQPPQLVAVESGRSVSCHLHTRPPVAATMQSGADPRRKPGPNPPGAGTPMTDPGTTR